jgi:hypothetical protein
MNAPVKQWSDSEGVQFFCRHLVALCVTFEHVGGNQADKEPSFAAYAGTLIKIQESIFLLTAGHILRQLESALRSDKIGITGAVLADTFGLNRICDQPIPFDLKNARMFYIDDNEQGLDFGVIYLEPYYVRLLAANGVFALSEKNWIHQHSVDFDAYVMLGLPEEFTSERVTASGDGVVSPTMFRVHRLASPPEDRPPTQYPQFVGQIDQELPIKSVKGMSGGPIFGFRLEPQTVYWIVALQSSWNPTTRIVYGCSLPILASLLAKTAAEQSDLMKR